MESEKWCKWTYLQNVNRLRLREWIYAYQGEGWGKGMARELEIDMYTLLYLKPIVNKDLQYSTWNSAQCYVAAWIKEEFEGGWIHVCVWLSGFCCAPGTITILFICYMPIKTKSIKNVKKIKSFCIILIKWNTTYKIENIHKSYL